MSVQPDLQLAPKESILRRGAEVVEIEAKALDLLAKSLENSFVEACEAILACVGRVIVTGMGKSGHIGRKWAATMAATGTPAFYVHPAEAAHGDLGMLVADDLLIVLSNSGNTPELQAFLRYAAAIRVPVIGVAARPDSVLLRRADIKICLPQTLEACRANIAPTTSTTLQLALGDAIAMTVMDMRGFSREDLKALHPGGALGLRLTSVGELMHGPARMPLVSGSAPMRDVIVIMTSRGFGIAGVTDAAGRLIGVITDGDVRRHFGELTTTTARDVMTPRPKTVSSSAYAEEALHFLNENEITCAFVMDRSSPVNCDVPVGIIHMHDFLRVGLD
ncbi:MAG TPA: KpsF/GutQ family sugar-phosphate isomerase [Sphingomicrobium sp.]|jgi:arabinose-5-phosphate isomerase|nr:KpsF/GutQ family sugar-phosphate isomerase [Sphingomicrobium sp.]